MRISNSFRLPGTAFFGGSRSRWLIPALLIANLGLSPIAAAGIITLDFEELDPLGVFMTDPYLENGFRISVTSCHYDTGTPETNLVDGSQWMGFDMAGCGSAEARLRLDFFGEEFTILDLDIPLNNFDHIFSSAGGMTTGCATSPVPGSECAGSLSFVGSEWMSVTWVDFVLTSSSGLPDQGVDNIRLQVVDISEPGTMALVSLALAGAIFVRRRRIS